MFQICHQRNAGRILFQSPLLSHFTLSSARVQHLHSHLGQGFRTAVLNKTKQAFHMKWRPQENSASPPAHMSRPCCPEGIAAVLDQVGSSCPWSPGVSPETRDSRENWGSRDSYGSGWSFLPIKTPAGNQDFVQLSGTREPFLSPTHRYRTQLLSCVFLISR